uniref:Protein KIAA0100-like n=3 Tax=Hirondellea gigas TaxID=1518452 RepID=A0A6A7FYG4_9CRUS
MWSLLLILFVLTVLYFAVVRGVPYLLSCLIVFWYQTEIRIGSISLLRLSFEDVLIKKAQVAIKVERVGAASSLFNQDEKKIFALKLYDVRVEKTVTETAVRQQQQQEQQADSPRPSYFSNSSSGNNFNSTASGANSNSSSSHSNNFAGAAAANKHQDSVEDVWHEACAHVLGLPNPKEFRIPPSVVTLAQFFAVRMVSVSVMCLREAWPSCLLHAEAERLDIEAATLNQTNVAINLSVENCLVKVLQPAVARNSESMIHTAHNSKAFPSATIPSAGQQSHDSKQNFYSRSHLPTLLFGQDKSSKVTAAVKSNAPPVITTSIFESMTEHQQQQASSSHVQEQNPSLLECSFSLKLYAELEADNVVAMEAVHIELQKPNLVARDRLFTFLQDKVLASTTTSSSSTSHSSNEQQSRQEYNYETGTGDFTSATPNQASLAAAYPTLASQLATYWLLVPQHVRIGVEQASLSIASSSVVCSVQAHLSAMDFRLSTPRAPHTLDVVPVLLPTLSCVLCVDGIKLSTSHNSSFALNRVKLDMKHKDRRVHCECEVHSLLYWFDHRDLTAFLPHLSSFQNFRTSAAATKMPARRRWSAVSILKESCTGCQVVVGLWDIGVGLQMPTGPALYLSLYHSYLDTGTGKFLVEAFISRLGKECCCVRPCRLSHCYCDAAANCISGRCKLRRNSGCDMEDRKNRSMNNLDSYEESRANLVLQGSNEKRRTSMTSHERGGDEVVSNFFGKLGKQEYMAGVCDLTNANLLSSSGDYINVMSPSEQLRLLAQQRGGSFKQQHVWGSPLSIGLWHVEINNKSTVIEEALDETNDEYEGVDRVPAGEEFNRSFSRMSSSSFGSHFYARKRKTAASDAGGGTRVVLNRTVSGGSASGCANNRLSYASTDSASTNSVSADASDRGYRGGIHLDNLQFEWSPSLANFVKAAKKYITELEEIFSWKSIKRKNVADEQKSNESPSFSLATFENVTLDCSNINLFAHTKHDVSLMLRCDSVGTLRTSSAIFTGITLVRFSPAALPYTCCPARNIKNDDVSVVSSIGVMSVVMVFSSGETLLEVQETCHLDWCTNTHLTALAVAKDIAALAAQFRRNKAVTDHSSKNRNRSSSLQLQVVAKGTASIRVQVSQRHEALITINSLTFLTARGLTSIKVGSINLLLDNHQIMQLTDAKLQSSYNSTELRTEREAFPELELPINKAWKLVVVNWKTTFPYQYNFAEAFSEDFISLLKWVKIIHRKSKHRDLFDDIKDFNVSNFSGEDDGYPKFNSAAATPGSSPSDENPLPPDIIIKVDRWFVSVEDDPFEVKLRYNYELMEDEYQESCKRKKAFNSRINDLQRSGAFLTSAKVEGLHKSLKEKDSETYIKRSKQMYETTPVRSELFTWVMEDLLIFALADPTMHGTENALSNLDSIDTAAPMPSECSSRLSSLWCRLISASLGVWRLLLRDYPQPLLDVTGLELWGRLLSTEQHPNRRGERRVLLGVSEPWHDGVVKRFLAPRKFYHDFTCEVRTFTIAYGPCWEPAMTQFNIALQSINSRSLDPSLPLPWWDKVRLLLHGRLLILADQFKLKLHASLDPYNTTEEMELTWTDLTLDWTNARLDFAGDLNVFVRTASKYDDARLIRMPNLRLTIKLTWVCHGDPEDHHSVVLYAPDRLPEYSSNQEHDSYRAFRSRNLDINISLETKTLVKDNVKVNPVIEMLFYGSTLRWFENLKFILSGVTRPIRRGLVFGNAGPRKTQLSRHYRTIHLALQFQRFDVRYWMSVGVKKGFHLSSERLSLSSEHSLSLEPRNSGLHQRSLSRWSVEYLNTELWQAQVWLQSLIAAGAGAADDDHDDNASNAAEQQPSPHRPGSSHGKKTTATDGKTDKNSDGWGKGSTKDELSKNYKSTSDGKLLDHATAAADKGSDRRKTVAEASKDNASASPKLSREDKELKNNTPAPPQVEKFYFLHVTKVAYMRETLTADHPYISSGPAESPNHRVVVHHLKGAWTNNNRDIVLALYDSWNKSQQLKHNLSPDVLETFSGAADGTTPQKNSVAASGFGRGHRSQQQHTMGGSSTAGGGATAAAGGGSEHAGLTSPASMQAPTGLEATPSPMARLQSGSGAELLHQLIKEADNNYVAYSEDCSNATDQPRDSSLLHGVADCVTDDVVYKHWLIELVNSQVLLKGCDTQGYVIISAAKSQVVQRVHRPVWRQQTLNSKTTWCGSLECMQYYATVSPSHKEMQMDNILWLSVANIEERADTQQPVDLTDIVGSNQSAGGVVTNTVGAVALDITGNANTQDMQLQRIVSRCRCEFYYVCYGELGVGRELLEEVQPPPPPTDELWGDHRDPTDTFTLMHYDLCISTNSLQYNMVVDILNKLLLYVDPVKKAASSALARMRFQLQLNSGDDLKKPIVKLQNQLRNHMSQLRGLEKDVYLVQRALDREPCDQLLLDKAALTAQVSSCKERLNSLSQELAIRIHCYNESQLRANHKLSVAQGDKVTTIRINEVFLRKAQWRITEADGQLGIAEVALSNFLYTKKSNSDDSGEHLLELGYVNMKNLLPNQVYTDILAPTILTSNCSLDRQKTLRIFCREKPPCGGISVIDHFEINVVPLDISLTYQFYKTILKFCFPNNPVVEDANSSRGSGGTGRRRRAAASHNSKANKDTHFYVELHKDDVEIMKQRAEQNKMFVYIKIPELKVRLSYKGMKDKNITDVTNFRLVVPSLEYHNVTWTWLDFLNGIKEHCKSALVPQVIKIKLNVGHRNSDATAELDEDEKARLLLGDRHMPQGARNTKKGLFKFKR